MFSFHKPRVYRSTEGCCICRAKSSSSRFTDSRKYEPETVKCFNLKEPRQGEICNACVLLVKRFKRLPMGVTKTWGHMVDARAGPGTKSLTKQKKRKEYNSELQQQQQQSNSSSGTKSSLFPEKFTKIFKKSSKSGKVKRNTSNVVVDSSVAWSSYCNQSLPSTPDSFDSDVEDNKQHFDMPPPLSSVVQFQTQTRASANRSRHNGSASTISAAAAVRIKCKKQSPKLRAGLFGSKRRKCLMPRKNVQVIDTAKFFDESEWHERHTCCGKFYEFGCAVIIDIAHYTPCLLHQRKGKTVREPQVQQRENHQKSAHPTQPIGNKPLHGELPIHQPMPVLKKHHLFYRRQSECFPLGDTFNGTQKSNSNTFVKTELTIGQALNAVSNNSTRPFGSDSKSGSNISFGPADNCSYSVEHTSSISQNMPLEKPNTNVPNTNPPQKITPLPPPPQKPTASTQFNPYTNFLHKIKADTASKIVKHSIDKFSTGQKHRDFKELKPMDRSFVLAQPVLQQIATPPAVIPNNLPMSPHAHTATGVSPIYSSSSASTKFSDNSSDSGFDENTLDRKSASPLQEDTDKKLASLHGVQTMFLASGVQVQGQPQNLVLTGNEVAVKIKQTRMQQSGNNSVGVIQQNIMKRGGIAEVNNAGTTVGTCTANAAHTKIRAIYTHNNSIQHENGITTIVPASSFAATTQTAAMMNALSTPSTVTITPAPHGVKKAKVFISNN